MTAFHISGRRWFDKVNGNTYHSARVFADGELAAVVPFQYGYGDAWEWSALVATVEAGALVGLRSGPHDSLRPWWQHIDESDGAHTLTTDVADVLKREAVAHGKGGDNDA